MISKNGQHPHDLLSTLVKNGQAADALPEESGSAGLGVSEATTMFQTIVQSRAGMTRAQSTIVNAYTTQPVAKLATVAHPKDIFAYADRRLMEGMLWGN